MPIAAPPAVHQAAVQDSVLSCLARGSHTWLATRPSPLDSATVTVAGAVAKVCYSRPAARGRSVDSLVPPGIAWRTGANEPTTLAVTGTFDVGGATLTPGRYVLLTVPGADGWVFAFHTSAETEPARVFQTMRRVALGRGTVERLATPVEQFTIRGENPGDGAAFVLEWGDWRVRLPVRAVP